MAMETDNMMSVETPQVMPDTSPDPAILNDEIAALLKTRIEASKRARKNLSTEWKRNVELRMGKATSTLTGGTILDEDVQTELNPDWSLTKTKTANLFSQVPEVRGTHENKQYAPAVSPFIKSLNYELGDKRANVGCGMEEVLNDVVNASGIGAIYVQYVARFETVEMPVEQAIQTAQGPIPVQAIPQPLQQELIKAGLLHMQPTERVVSDKFAAPRVSPINLLWPDEFTGSNFDDADYIGHDGRLSWAEAKNEFNLKDDEKDNLAGGDYRTDEQLRTSGETGGPVRIPKVKFTRLFYWRYRLDPEEKHFSAIWEIVYLDGKVEPVKHEPWKGQKYDEASRKYIGATKFPIRVLTVTYITDNAIPPSDSSAGRPQVNDLRRSRSQMFMNREHSIPIRGFDTNRIPPELQDLLMRGNWQGMIPVNGRGQDAIWEVARASYPSEDLTFDVAAKADLMETWQIGPNQMGTTAPGRQTKSQVENVQSNFATRIGQERNRVSAFFLGVCEVLSGLMVLYSDFPILTDQERQTMMQTWDNKHILHDLVLKIRPDSTIVLDSQARIQRLMNFLNMTAKSGFINPLPVITEIAELSGLDPADVVIQPQPKGPDEPNISYRMSGKDDLINPVVMAMLVKHKQAPSPEELDTAKKILLSAQSTEPAQPSQPSPDGAEQSGAPAEHPPSAGAPVSTPEGANPNWNIAAKVAKRSRDAQAGA